MANGAYVQARIDPQVKADAQAVLAKLGVSMSDAIGFYFRQIVLRQAIPFELKIPNELTAETLDKSDRGEDVHEFSSVEELMEDARN